MDCTKTWRVCPTPPLKLVAQWLATQRHGMVKCGPGRWEGLRLGTYRARRLRWVGGTNAPMYTPPVHHKQSGTIPRFGWGGDSEPSLPLLLVARVLSGAADADAVFLCLPPL